MTKQESDELIRSLIVSTNDGTLDEPWQDFDDPNTKEDDQLLILRCVYKGLPVFLDRRFFQSASGVYFYNLIRYGNPGDAQIVWNYQPNDPLTDELWDTIRESVNEKE